jgi:dihydropyrimidinase
MQITGKATHTISNGILKYADGDLRVEKGMGNYIKRPAYQPMFHALEKIAKANVPTAVKR